MLRPRQNRIPVTSGPRLVEMADPSRVEALIRASNVRIIRRHKRDIVELQLLDYADDSRVPPRLGNSQSYTSYKSETPWNPPRVWRFKRFPLLGFPARGEPCAAHTERGRCARALPTSPGDSVARGI